jgi:hypothetical protein
MRHVNRASRFQAYMVPCTYEVERAQLEQNLRDGAITREEFDRLLSKLAVDDDREEEK